MTTLQALPSLSSDYALTDEQIAFFQKNGHVLLRNLITPEELAAFRPTINDAADRFNTETRPLAERDTYGKAFLQIPNLFVQDEGVAQFVLARRFAKVAAQLLEVSGVRIYHDQALYKEPGGGMTPWHQDQHYWPLETPKTITMWMPLVDLPPHVGSMTFADGSHEVGYLGDMPISDDSQSVIENLIAEKGFNRTHYGAMNAGDATFHYGWTLHGAPGNPTPNMREVMTVIYYPEDARVSVPANASQQADLERWLPGCKPGELAASPINPVAYSSRN